MSVVYLQFCVIYITAPEESSAVLQTDGEGKTCGRHRLRQRERAPKAYPRNDLLDERLSSILKSSNCE